MERIQFFPSETLGKTLKEDAKLRGISVSHLVIEILTNHYGLGREKRPISEITKDVLREVKEFVDTHPSGKPFDLLTASHTFAEIEMQFQGKPSAARASVGRTFAARIGKNEFANVVVAKKDGAILRNKNHATLYQIIETSEEDTQNDE